MGNRICHFSPTIVSFHSLRVLALLLWIGDSSVDLCRRNLRVVFLLRVVRRVPSAFVELSTSLIIMSVIPLLLRGMGYIVFPSCRGSWWTRTTRLLLLCCCHILAVFYRIRIP